MSTDVFKAGYLPGLADAEVQWHRQAIGAPDAPLWVDLPVLRVDQMTALAQRVRAASQRHLKPLRVSDIVQVLDRATARLLDPREPHRQTLELRLPQATGLDAEMVRLNLNAYLQTFRGLQLSRFVAQDFANPKVLDEFQPSPNGGWSRALGPELLVHVWAGNVPGLPMWSWVSGLLVKAGGLGKVSRAEPVFATVFAQLLAEVAPEWADCFAVLWWPSAQDDAPGTTAMAQESTAFALADVVLAYGGQEALRAMQAQVPVGTRFLPHGHKLSWGLVSSAALSTRQGPYVARQAALDVVRHDQQGCYSPHVFYVERGASTSPLDFAQQLAHALSNLQHKLPRRVLSLEEAAQVGAWRQTHELAALAPSGRSVLGQHGDQACVVYSDRPLPLAPGPLQRSVLVVAVDALREVIPLVAPMREFLQTVGLAAAPDELLGLAEALGQAGVTRLCALGAMAAPEAGWHHDGRFSLLDLVRMVDIEASTEREAERFTDYEV